MELAIGEAAGRFFGSSPGQGELKLVSRVLQALPAAFKPFDVAAEFALRNTSGAAGLLAFTLQERAMNFIDAPSESPAVDQFHPLIMPELTVTNRRLMDAWGTFGGRPMLTRDVFAYDLLRRVDQGAYIDAIQKLPHPGLAQHVIVTATRYAELTEFCQLLGQVDLAFNADGTWIKHSAVPFLLLAACTERLSDTAEPISLWVSDDRAQQHRGADPSQGYARDPDGIGGIRVVDDGPLVGSGEAATATAG